MEKIKRGDIVEVTPWLPDDNPFNTRFPQYVALYRRLSDEELEQRYQEDRDNGTTRDDAGETRIHDKVESWTLSPAEAFPDMRWKCFLVVTDLHPEWTSWHKKPTFLREGIHLETGTKVLFQDRHVLAVVKK